MAGILVLLVGTIPAQGLAQSSRIKDLLRKVDPARIYTDVLDLAALGTRFSASSEFKKATELVRKKLGFRSVFDVIGLDAGHIRGSHGRLPDDPLDGPVYLSTTTVGAGHRLLASDVRDLILENLFRTRPGGP